MDMANAPARPSLHTLAGSQSRIAEHRATHEQWIAMQRAYDAGSPCPSCRARLDDEVSLFQLLRVTRMPWQSSLQDCHGLIAQLDAAAAKT